MQDVLFDLPNSFKGIATMMLQSEFPLKNDEGQKDIQEKAFHRKIIPTLCR